MQLLSLGKQENQWMAPLPPSPLSAQPGCLGKTLIGLSGLLNSPCWPYTLDAALYNILGSRTSSGGRLQSCLDLGPRPGLAVVFKQVNWF